MSHHGLHQPLGWQTMRIWDPNGFGFPPASRLRLEDLLGMLLVDGAVHADRGAQPVHPLVLLDAPQHGGQGGPTQVG